MIKNICGNLEIIKNNRVMINKIRTHVYSFNCKLVREYIKIVQKDISKFKNFDEQLFKMFDISTNKTVEDEYNEVSNYYLFKGKK